jgi:hypothetical protein
VSLLLIELHLNQNQFLSISNFVFFTKDEISLKTISNNIKYSNKNSSLSLNHIKNKIKQTSKVVKVKTKSISPNINSKRPKFNDTKGIV